jgi:hypothetical protein
MAREPQRNVFGFTFAEWYAAATRGRESLTDHTEGQRMRRWWKNGRSTTDYLETDGWGYKSVHWHIKQARMNAT